MHLFNRIVLSDKVVLTAIIANTIVIVLQQFDLDYFILGFLDVFLTLFFVFELTAKLKYFGLKGYLNNNWNKFDSFLIICSTPSLLSFVDIPSYVWIDSIISLRVLRIFKFFRLIKFIPNINELAISIQKAIKTSAIVLISFILLVAVFSILSCALFRDVVPEYYGNPAESFYSTFRLFSIEGWYEIPDTIASRSSLLFSLFAKVYFMILLLGGGIFGLSLVNSIFVDAMVSDNNSQLEIEVSELKSKITELSNQIESLNNLITYKNSSNGL